MGLDRREKIFVAIVTAAGFGLRLYFLAAYENIFSWEAEDYSKINLVLTWMQNGMPYPDPNFGPLHTWLIYLLTRPFEDMVLPVRIFSLVTGAATLPVFYLVARRLGAGAAATATMLFAFFPVHVRAGATSLAEAPYTLAFFGGLALFFAHDAKRQASFAYLAGSAACLTAAAMLRFEAWLFYPLLCLLALRRGVVRAVGYGALLAVFPAWHMFYCWKTTGNPLAFGQTSASSFLLYLPQMPLSYRASAWLVAFWHALSPPLFVLCWLGLVWAAFARKGGMLVALFLFPYAFLSYRTLRGMIDPALLRCSVVLAGLLIPLAGGALWNAMRVLLRRERAAQIGTGVVTAAMAVFMTTWAVAQAEENRLPKDVKELARFLREETRPDDRIILDKRFHPYLVVESRHDPDAFASLLYEGGADHRQGEIRAPRAQVFPAGLPAGAGGHVGPRHQTL
ncbi:MAG: glycosyltransferase family 39 protein [Deltaproteobacteria bacterium]|nr:glycosyltransferase family 39 protein [Deltaproteobacteria bacterium]